MRRRFEKYQAGGPVQEGSSGMPQIPVADSRLAEKSKRSPEIFGLDLPHPNARQGIMGGVNPYHHKDSPKDYAGKAETLKRMKSAPNARGVGSLMVPQRPQGGPPQGGPPQGGPPQGGGGGDAWLGEIWSGLNSGARGYQKGGAVSSPGMTMYNNAMADLESGGIGYAMGGAVIPGAQQVDNPRMQPPMQQPPMQQPPMQPPMQPRMQQPMQQPMQQSAQAPMVGHPMNQPMPGQGGGGTDYRWSQPVPQNQPLYTGIQGLAQGGEVRKAEELAQYGRNGDTTLMHINPAELEGLQQLLGPVTENPDTGLPEAFAFLPFLIGAALGAVGTGAVTDWDPKAMALGGLAGGVGGAFLAPAAVGGSAGTAALTGSAGGAQILPAAGSTSLVTGSFGPGVGGALAPGAVNASTLGLTATPGVLGSGSTAGAGSLLSAAGLPQTAASVGGSAMNTAAGSALGGAPTVGGTFAPGVAGAYTPVAGAAKPGIAGLLKTHGPKIASAIGGGGGKKQRPQMMAPPPTAAPKGIAPPPRNVGSQRPPTPGIRKRPIPGRRRMRARGRRV